MKTKTQRTRYKVMTPERAEQILHTHRAQYSKAYRLLLDRKGEWVPLPQIGLITKSRCVSSIINSLRSYFHCDIENKQERKWNPDGTQTVHSCYRLLKTPAGEHINPLAD